MQPDPSFNIAVAEFSVQTEANSQLKKGDGLALASDLYRRLQANVDDLTISGSFNYQIRSPEQTCAIRGDTPEERALDAQRLAEKIGADILVYGTLSPRENRADFIPEFYINYKGFEQGDEVTGDHRLGKRCLSICRLTMRTQQENKGLTARNRAVVHIIIRLAYCSSTTMTGIGAIPGADDLEVGLKGEVKKLYLLLGNTLWKASGSGNPRIVQSIIRISPENYRPHWS
jgi:hypothetical protein